MEFLIVVLFLGPLFFALGLITGISEDKASGKNDSKSSYKVELVSYAEYNDSENGRPMQYDLVKNTDFPISIYNEKCQIKKLI